MALCVGSIKTHSNTFNKQLLLIVSYLTLDPQILYFLGVQVLKGFSFCHVRPASHDDLHMIRIQLRFFPNNLPFNLSGLIPCSRLCIECLYFLASIFWSFDSTSLCFSLCTFDSFLGVSLCFPDTISRSAWPSFLYFLVWHTIFFGFPFFFLSALGSGSSTIYGSVQA